MYCKLQYYIKSVHNLYRINSSKVYCKLSHIDQCITSVVVLIVAKCIVNQITTEKGNRLKLY